MTFLQIVGGIAVVLFASAALLIVLINLGATPLDDERPQE